MVAFRDYGRLDPRSGRGRFEKRYASGSRRPRLRARRTSALWQAARAAGKGIISRGGFDMQPQVIRAAPLSVLIALADSDFDVASILPALRPHYALVCATPAQAVETASQFEPDVVLIDFRMPDPWGVARRLAQA